MFYWRSTYVLDYTKQLDPEKGYEVAKRFLLFFRVTIYIIHIANQYVSLGQIVSCQIWYMGRFVTNDKLLLYDKISDKNSKKINFQRLFRL